MAYGTDMADMAYVGSTSGQMFLRQNVNGVFLLLPNYPGNGAQVDDIAVDASDWRRAVTISNDGRILMTVDGGNQWVNLRGNAGAALIFMRSIVLVKAGAETVLLIGGDPPAGSSGVVRTINPDMSQPNPNVVWSEFGTGLPRAPVLDLQYYPARMFQTGDPGGDLVLAGTLGRGAWTIENAAKS
jgi:hypothetical protein